MPNDMGIWFGMLTQNEKEDVIKEVGKLAAELFKDKKEAIRDAVGLRDLRGGDRMEAYRQRQPEIWAQLQTFSPQEHARQMRDWDRLERRVSFSSPRAARKITGAAAQGNAAETSQAFVPGDI